jgi:hypothetical protein
MTSPDLKYCEDCRWFVDGRNYYLPYDRCSNPIAVERVKVNLVRKTKHFERCMEARDTSGVCGVSAKQFEVRAPQPAKINAVTRFLRNVSRGQS